MEFDFDTILDEEERKREHSSKGRGRSESSDSSQSDKRKKKRHFSGTDFEIHGAFKSKEDAKKKEKKVKGSFIQEREIRGQKRFVVLKEK